MGNLAQNVDDIIPKFLDDVIRKNRNLFELGLSIIEDIQAIHIEIQPGMPVKDVIDDWRLISFRDKRTGRNQVLLLGDSQKKGNSWITSSIVLIDLPQNIVVTKSMSVYKLGSQGNGEPPRRHLIHVCAALHKWGLGAALGVRALM